MRGGGEDSVSGKERLSPRPGDGDLGAELEVSRVTEQRDTSKRGSAHHALGLGSNGGEGPDREVKRLVVDASRARVL